MTMLYLDLGMGAAGDMLNAALLELLPQHRDEFLQIMNGLGLPGVSVTAEPSIKCGITGTHVDVSVHGISEQSVDVTDAQPTRHHHHDHGSPRQETGDHDHHDAPETPDGGQQHASIEHIQSHSHSSYPRIIEIVNGLDIPQRVRADAIAVYSLLAEAEAVVHGMPVDEIHFHEVGESDAIADIVGACLLMSWLAPQRVLASPVHVGSGKVSCAHGIVPVPAPATERLLRGIPVYGGAVRGELCTPTGAALLKYFVDEFVQAMPVMTIRAAGYGMGTKDFEAANCVRALLGEVAELGASGDVVELSCNLDDMTGERLGYAQEQLFAAGAVEVFTTAVTMKKGRPGILLTCLCPVAQRDDVVRAIFRHTTTIGVREHLCHRFTLDRSEEAVQTPYGQVRVKTVSGYGVRRSKPEYEDLAAVADREGLDLETVGRVVSEAWQGRSSAAAAVSTARSVRDVVGQA